MIRYAEKSDLNEIVELWNICFTDSDEFSKWYFKNKYSEKNTLIYVKDNKICSMLQELPFEFKNFGKATYIYGACTHPSYRKKGIMSKLINFSFQNDIKKGIKASILIPERKELFDYYKKFGYIPISGIKKEFITKNNANTIGFSEYSLKKADYKDIASINNLYEKKFISNCCILRTENYWRMQIDMFKALNGEVFCLYRDNTLEAYAFVWNEKIIQAQEIFFENISAKNTITQKILSTMNKDTIEILLHDKEKNSPLGCIKFYSEEKSNTDKEYIMNLMFN